MADLEWCTFKSKPVIHARAFVKLYNWRNGGKVYESHGIIELKKMRALTTKNLHNLDIYQIIEISLVLHNTHVVPRDQDKFVFYVNNYIDGN